MRPWKILQCGAVLDDAKAEADQDEKEGIFTRRLATLLEKGNKCGPPVTTMLADGIFELRGNQIRAFFFFATEQRIVFVHWIKKKQSKVPRSDIDKALRIKKDIEEQWRRADGKNNSRTISIH